MSMNGKYCKAFQVGQLREFGGWSAGARAFRSVRPEGGGEAVERALEDEDVLYVQENYTVTNGIFLDENVVFDDVTPEWVEFCKTTLGFEVPAEHVN